MKGDPITVDGHPVTGEGGDDAIVEVVQIAVISIAAIPSERPSAMVR